VSEAITVMHLRASNFVGGPEKQILEHFSRLDNNRFRPILGTFVEDGAHDPLGDAAEARGFQCVRLPSQSPLNPMAILHLTRVVKNENVDILCTHGYKPNVLGFFAAKLARISTIAISRGWTSENAKIRFYEALDRRFLQMSDHVVAVSAGQQDKILACGVPLEKISVIHNAINLDEFMITKRVMIRKELGLPDDAILVASAGRLSPEKNYSAMIEVAAQVAPKNSSVYFAIFGEGVLRRDLEGRIRDAGLGGRFFLPGFRIDLQALFYEIDIFMLPSFTEGLPNVALEAFAAMKPIVATAVGGTPEVVQDGVSGFLTRPDEHELMACHVLTLADDPALRQRLGEAGYAFIKENFGFGAQTTAYEHLYQDLYQTKKRRH
jgi:glycosyltransferase involved in cell wall biosynthesis